MAASRARVAMTPTELDEFLASQLKVQVATVGRDGAPHLATLFYVMDGDRLAFWTYAASQKVRNLQRDSRVTCLVEDGTDYFELRGASLRGVAELVDDPDEVRRIGTTVAVRMAGLPDADALGEVGRGAVEGQVRKRVAVLVTPEQVATWDHRKMPAAPSARSEEGRQHA